MSLAAILAFVMKVLPTVLDLINRVVAYAHDNKMINLGEAKAIAAGVERLNETLAKAKAAADEAEAAHASDATDDAFDRDFERKDQ
ncbi:hypothetical protein LG047_15190 [Methylocystis sp. WRRC1]|uniref:hypothetical protein n=1 Tax=Methylocystis sp. WRRC1 TaxID=1732014 RepID=UPI001D14A3BD|nr:hypothetical protein [Methylocystis sp. WRRC1]MCC3246645.1 hypothetical protein [Methylocystis sp. WRRC1]